MAENDKEWGIRMDLRNSGDLPPIAGGAPDDVDARGDLVKYVDKAMYEAEPVGDSDGVGYWAPPSVYLLSATPDPLGAIAAMCAMYEGRVVRGLGDLTDEDRRRYWDEVNATHLKAPLEAVDLEFLLEGVSRSFTHQLVRQRTAVYAQESLRFAVKHEIAARPGPLVAGDRTASAIWSDAMEAAWGYYNALIGCGMPAEEARGVLPHDTLTRVVYKTNLRNLLEHAGNRLCTQAQFEWRMVFSGIVAAIRGYRPPRGLDRSVVRGGAGVSEWEWQFAHIADSAVFKPVCFSLGRCPFGASFDRGCTIRARVDAGRFDEVDDAEWLADPTAGWVR